MPCDTVRLIPVALEKCDAKTMLSALTALGFAPSLVGDIIQFGDGEWIDTKSGKAQLAARRDKNEIKVYYSRAVLEQATKRGWSLQQAKAKQPGQLAFVLARR